MQTHRVHEHLSLTILAQIKADKAEKKHPSADFKKEKRTSGSMHHMWTGANTNFKNDSHVMVAFVESFSTIHLRPF